MGDMVGELFYGVEITSKEHERLDEILDVYGNKDDNYNKDFNGCTLNAPNETDEYFVIIKDSHLSAYNRSEPLEPHHLTIKEEWDQQINNFCEKHGVTKKVENSKPQWWLCGRYN